MHQRRHAPRDPAPVPWGWIGFMCGDDGAGGRAVLPSGAQLDHLEMRQVRATVLDPCAFDDAPWPDPREEDVAISAAVEGEAERRLAHQADTRGRCTLDRSVPRGPLSSLAGTGLARTVARWAVSASAIQVCTLTSSSIAARRTARWRATGTRVASWTVGASWGWRAIGDSFRANRRQIGGEQGGFTRALVGGCERPELREEGLCFQPRRPLVAPREPMVTLPHAGRHDVMRELKADDEAPPQAKAHAGAKHGDDALPGAGPLELEPDDGRHARGMPARQEGEHGGGVVFPLLLAAAADERGWRARELDLHDAGGVDVEEGEAPLQAAVNADHSAHDSTAMMARPITSTTWGTTAFPRARSSSRHRALASRLETP